VVYALQSSSFMCVLVAFVFLFATSDYTLGIFKQFGFFVMLSV